MASATPQMQQNECRASAPVGCWLCPYARFHQLFSRVVISHNIIVGSSRGGTPLIGDSPLLRRFSAAYLGPDTPGILHFHLLWVAHRAINDCGHPAQNALYRPAIGINSYELRLFGEVPGDSCTRLG
jgi:hypothetical protein